MSIASLSSLAGPYAAPVVGALKAASSSGSSPSVTGADSANGASFASMLANVSNAANPLNFISAPTSNAGEIQPNSIFGELTSLLSSV